MADELTRDNVDTFAAFVRDSARIIEDRVDQMRDRIQHLQDFFKEAEEVLDHRGYTDAYAVDELRQTLQRYRAYFNR